jgi:hypothetical protein
MDRRPRATQRMSMRSGLLDTDPDHHSSERAHIRLKVLQLMRHLIIAEVDEKASLQFSLRKWVSQG